MKFFSIYEVLNSIICAVALGALFGFSYKGSKSIFFAAAKLIFLIPKKIVKLFYKKSINITGKVGIVIDNLIDALYFLLFGFSIILMFYITLDGVFRFYIIFITLFIFTLSSRLFGAPVNRAFNFIFFKIYNVLDKIIYYVFIPAEYIISFLNKNAEKLKKCIYGKKLRYKSKKISKRKIEELNKILLKSSTLKFQ